MYLSVLEDTGFWLESKVLSFIQDQEEEDLKRHRVVYQQIIQVRIFSLSSPEDMLNDFRERGREGERQGGKY